MLELGAADALRRKRVIRYQQNPMSDLRQGLGCFGRQRRTVSTPAFKPPRQTVRNDGCYCAFPRQRSQAVKHLMLLCVSEPLLWPGSDRESLVHTVTV